MNNDQGNFILHLAATWNDLKLVKSILSECPYLLLEPHLKEQLLIHVTTHVGHLAVIKVLVAALTFISAKISDEERRRLNLYAVKDKNVYESLSIRPSIP